MRLLKLVILMLMSYLRLSQAWVIIESMVGSQKETFSQTVPCFRYYQTPQMCRAVSAINFVAT